MSTEDPGSRAQRLRQRVLFDEVSDQYDASRPVYTDVVIGRLVDAAGLDDGSSVLEIGCGTGQLTRQLAARGVMLTAIDIGPSMITAARRHLGHGAVTFRVTSFEDMVADDGTFDLIVAADAFHWIDPDLRFSKSARILRPGGWLAVLSIRQIYDEPLGTALRQMWVARSDDDGGWLTQPSPTVAQSIAASAHFGTPTESTRSSRRSLPAWAVLGLETTRATFLGWGTEERRAFAEELRGHLPVQRVDLTEVVTLVMAQAVRPPG